MADKRNKLTYTIEINDKGKIKIDGLTSSFVQADNAVNKLTADIKNQQTAMAGATKDGLNPMIDKTGLAGATIVELGRTISDSNYGIRGMANNLSQLSTLMITLISTTGGLANGLKALKAAFMGPLGLIILFQTVVTLLERFSMKQDEAAESTQNLTAALDEQQLMFDVLAKRINKYNVSGKALDQTIKVLSSEFSQFRNALEKLSDKTPESLKGLIDRFMEYQDVQKAIKDTQEEIKDDVDGRVLLEEKLFKLILRRSELEKEFTKNTKDKNNEEERTQALITGTIADYNNQIQILQKTQKQTATTAEQYTILENRIDSLRKKIAILKGETETPIVESVKAVARVFADIDKNGKVVARDSAEEVVNIYKAALESGKAGVAELAELGERYNELTKRSENNLKAGLKFIKDQAKQVTGLFDATQQSLKFVGDTILSYHDARMDALKRERDYVLNSGQLTGAAQRKAIEDLEKREIRSQQRKIKAERDLFTIKQSLLIAEEVMKIKADFAERKRMFEQQTVYFVNAQGRIVAKAAESTADATFSIGEFARQLGPIGIAAYAVTIGGLIASIMSARKKAQASLSSLGAPSMGGGTGGVGGVEAPDFNVVGASPESQLAQSVVSQQQKPLRAFVVNKDIKTAEELERNTVKALG